MRRGDRRPLGTLMTLVAVGLAGFALQQRDTRALAVADPAVHAAQARAAEVRRRFDQAVVMLHARQFEHAAVALHRVLELDPALPEAHVNMGFAMIGLGRPREARDFFEGATALRPSQANAYYGLALAAEALQDLPVARGAMRSYLHLARDEPASHLARARAALWEWERAPAAGDDGTGREVASGLRMSPAGPPAPRPDGAAIPAHGNRFPEPVTRRHGR